MPLWKKILGRLLLPILIPKGNFPILTATPDYNCLNNEKPLTNRRIGAFTRDINLQKMKAFCKDHKCTVNDLTGAIMMNTFHEYMDKNKHQDGKSYEISKSIHFAVPISLREPFKGNDTSNVKLTNDFVSAFITLPVCKDFKESLKKVKDIYDSIKYSLDIFGVYETFNMTVNLPFTLSKTGLDFLSTKFTCIYSNINASTRVVNWAGYQQTGGFFYVPSVCYLTTGVTIIRGGENVSLAVISDENRLVNPQMFVDIYVDKLNKALEGY